MLLVGEASMVEAILLAARLAAVRRGSQPLRGA
jgi:hypothetical protein